MRDIERHGLQIRASGGADNQPVELWSHAVIAQKLSYVHQNPVEEGLVFRAEDYVYSSAIDYAGGKGMLDIFVIG
jgi:predicted ATPase